MDSEKTYKYTNSSDEIVEVSQDHIDTAVEIYQELSKNSRSKKVSWRKHRRMMEQEGIDDSDINENYRQLIKNARKRKGLLPSVETHADMLATEKINAIKEEMGAIVSSRLEANDEFTRLSRLKREWTRELLMIEAISEKMNEFDWTGFNLDAPDYRYNESSDSKTMLVALADIHYGYEVEGYYSRELAQELLAKYTQKIIDLGKKENVTELIISGLGDYAEGMLRPSSIADSQISPVEQMVEVTWLILEMVKTLSEHFAVKYGGIAGNHDRLVQNKNDVIARETYMTINREIMKRVANESGMFEYIETDSMYHHIFDINGVVIFAHHGDRHSMKPLTLLSQLSINHGTPINIVLAGHTHTHSVNEVGYDKFQVVTGSIKGADEFSEKINKKSSRSQVAILIDESGEFDIRQIKL